MQKILVPEVQKNTKLKPNSRLLEVISTWTKDSKKSFRKRYFTRTVSDGKRNSICKAKLKDPEGREIQCGEKYSSPSSTTELEHLTCHADLPEFKSVTEQRENSILNYGFKEVEVPSFETSALQFLLSCNNTWNAFNNYYWNVIVTKYLCREPFQGPAAKSHLSKQNVKILESLLKVLFRCPFSSISEDEGTVTGKTKVLHNLHVFDPIDWQFKSYFLRYFGTNSKEATVLIQHWRETFIEFKLDTRIISAFSSDHAISVCPKWNEFGPYHMWYPFVGSRSGRSL